MCTKKNCTTSCKCCAVSGRKTPISSHEISSIL